LEQKQIASFVIRFQLVDFDTKTKEKQWRIKVTHVQEDEELLFETSEEAMNFMKQVVGDS